MTGWSFVWLLTRRELRDQLRDWRILLPLIALTLFFPFLMLAGTGIATDYIMQYNAERVAERVVPFFTMVVGFFPVTVSLVIALESFVGEKERGTIEPLLSTPLYDWQLYFGKLLAGFCLPAIAIVVDLTLYLLLIHWMNIKVPDTLTLLQAILISLVQAVLMVSGALVISTQSTSVRGANLLVSFIVIPVGLLLQGESLMLFWGNHTGVWLTILAVAIMAVLIIRLGLTRFKREYLLGREIDVLNLRWAWQTFLVYFRGRATSLRQWYRQEVALSLQKMRLALALIVILGLVGTQAAYQWIQSQPIQSDASLHKLLQALETAANWPGQELNMGSVFWHNLRAVTSISVMGMLSFGVLGALFYLLNMSLIGGVIGVIARMGYSPWLVALAGVLPHGIFEIPALMLAVASALYAGALLITPQPERALGEILIETWANWAKVMLGLALPLLLLAAVIEAFVTPRLLAFVLP